MLHLLLASLVWAFSYGFIKGQLTGLDATAVAVLRLACAALVFLPFLRLRKIASRHVWRLGVIGAVQFGVMYIAYLKAFAFLAAHEVVLCTIFTPVYVALIDGAIEHSWRWRHLGAALLALVGAGVILWHRAPGSNATAGFLLMQFSNLCFAAGQLAWRKERARLPQITEREAFGLLYLGAVAAGLIASFFTTNWAAFRPSPAQWGVMVYLGVIASGVGFFWWNLGALRVNGGTLAVMNNAKIPVGILVSLLCFGESADPIRLLLSGAIMLIAVGLAENWFNPKTLTTNEHE